MAGKQPDSPYFAGNYYLFHKGRTPDGVDLHQLVLPTSRCNQVLQIAHCMPLAGHLGCKKTSGKINKYFFWPGMHKYVSTLCQTCIGCQKTAKQCQVKAPLMPLPVISQPFNRMATNIVGPIPRTKHGKKFIFTLIHFATHYPEAVPLCCIGFKKCSNCYGGNFFLNMAYLQKF